jgi:hypothetical protein
VIPNFSATFSDVTPIPNKQFLAYSCSKTASPRREGSNMLFISKRDIFSTPPAIPTSITFP